MKISDAIALIDPTRSVDQCQRYDSPIWESDIDVFVNLFRINYCGWSDEFSKRMTKHWVMSWICTDTRVGIAVYCWDKVPVAFSAQSARKSDENITFLTQESAKMVRDAIYVIIGEQDDDVDIVDMDEEIPNQYITSSQSGRDGFKFSLVSTGDAQ